MMMPTAYDDDDNGDDDGGGAFKGDQGATQYSAKSAKKGQMGSRLLTQPPQVHVTVVLMMMIIVQKKTVDECPFFSAYRSLIKVASKLKFRQGIVTFKRIKIKLL